MPQDQNPYVAPALVEQSAASTSAAPVRRDAFVVLLAEASRSILWRLNSALYFISGWPDPRVSNRVIKLLGAVVVFWGAWRLAAVPSHSLVRPVVRAVVAISVGGHAARLLLVDSGGGGLPLEAATNLVDAVALSACALCLVPLLRATAGRGWASSAAILATAYLLVSVFGAVDLLRPSEWLDMDASVAAARRHDAVGLARLSVTTPRAFVSLALWGLATWACVIAAHLPSKAPPLQPHAQLRSARD
jgi:hypothetical protein